VVKNSTRDFGEPRAGGLGRYDHPSRATVGADLKYGLSSNLTLEATINPDFGQVESDPAQLNLTAFETFFQERRPFFLEGMSIFQFGPDPEMLFYSRRIGRAPQLAGLAPDGVDIPGASRILGAGKLTGRVAGGTSLGVLTAVTERTEAGGTTIEPRTLYAMARSTRELRQGESALGAIASVVDRALTDAESPYLRRAAYAAGVDGRHRFDKGRYELVGSFAASSVRGSASAITRTQRSSVHQYQRPDDDLVVDTTRTSLDGTSWRVVAKKIAGLVRGSVSYQRISAGFETNDFGRQRRRTLDERRMRGAGVSCPGREIRHTLPRVAQPLLGFGQARFGFALHFFEPADRCFRLETARLEGCPLVLGTATLEADDVGFA
jgi:hypothetical protein